MSRLHSVWFVLALFVLINPPAAEAQDIVSMFKRTKPAVVSVIPRDAFGVEQGIGSAFFIDSNVIVTNHHVVSGAYGVIVRTKDSTEFECPHILAQDSALDIAVLRVNVTAPEKIAILENNESQIDQGQRVYVVGNPLGLQQSVSDG